MTLGRALSVAAMAAAFALAAAQPAAAQSDRARQLRADRATAQHFAALMPKPAEAWKATQPKPDWRDDGAEARARYWTTDGQGRFTLVIETRSRGLMYKKDRLDDPRGAERRGYTVAKVGDRPALVRARPGKTEVRLWVDDRILVLAIGTASFEEIEAHLKTLDFAKLAAVK